MLGDMDCLIVNFISNYTINLLKQLVQYDSNQVNKLKPTPFKNVGNWTKIYIFYSVPVNLGDAPIHVFVRIRGIFICGEIFSFCFCFVKRAVSIIPSTKRV